MVLNVYWDERTICLWGVKWTVSTVLILETTILTMTPSHVTETPVELASSRRNSISMISYWDSIVWKDRFSLGPFNSMQITEVTFLKVGGALWLVLKSASKPLMWLSEEWPASNDWLVEWLCCRSRWQDILLQRFLQWGSKGNRSISKFHNGKVGKLDQSHSDVE